MSRHNGPPQGHRVPPPQPRPVEREEAEEAMDAEEVETDDLLQSIAGRSQADIAEKLVLALETNPESEETRAVVKYFIRKLYVTNGGLPFNKADAIPYKLDELESKELVNVLENMIIYQARTKQKDLISKAVNLLANLTAIIDQDAANKIANEIQRDEVLRESLWTVFLGQKFSPLVSLIITGGSYLSNLVLNYQNGKRVAKAGGEPSGGTGNGRSTSGVSSNESNKASV